MLKQIIWSQRGDEEKRINTGLRIKVTVKEEFRYIIIAFFINILTMKLLGLINFCVVLRENHALRNEYRYNE